MKIVWTLLAVLLLGLVYWAIQLYYQRQNSMRAPRIPLHKIANTDKVDRRGDIVFIHGLSGDYKSTWTHPSSQFYWPEHLGNDLKDFGIWAIDYDASISEWLGHTLSIQERSKQLLTALKNAGLGERRIVFIGHSMGGLVIKQMLQDSKNMNVKEWSEIAEVTKGVVLLGTPNTGSRYANYLDYLKSLAQATVTARQLEESNEYLMDMNQWYRNNIEDMEVITMAFYETKNTGPRLVVDRASADPGIAKIEVVAADENHEFICKPFSAEVLVYQSVKRFINDKVLPLPSTYNISFEDFTEEYQKQSANNSLQDYKELHCGQAFQWKAVIRDIKTDDHEPNYSLSATPDAPPLDWIVAAFKPYHFVKMKRVGDTIVIRGVISKASSKVGAILKDCRVLP